EWSASARSCARKTADLRTTFRDGRYGLLQPTAVAEANSLNDGFGEKSGNPIDLSSNDSATSVHVAQVTGSDAVWDLHRRLRRCPLSSQSSISSRYSCLMKTYMGPGPPFIRFSLSESRAIGSRCLLFSSRSPWRDAMRRSLFTLTLVWASITASLLVMRAPRNLRRPH